MDWGFYGKPWYGKYGKFGKPYGKFYKFGKPYSKFYKYGKPWFWGI